MSFEDRIEVNPAILVGKPVVKGTRISVELVLDLLAQGWSEADIISNYPGLAAEDVKACLAYARDASILESRDDWAGHFSVVDERHIRMIPLPGSGQI